MVLSPPFLWVGQTAYTSLMYLPMEKAVQK